MKKPAGQQIGRAEEAFDAQCDKIRQNDITEKYIGLAEDVLSEFLGQLRETKDRALTPGRETQLQALLDFIRKRDKNGKHLFRIHGFRVFIKHPKEDYFLGSLDIEWAEKKKPEVADAELFLGLEVMSQITTATSPTTGAPIPDEAQDLLLRKWMLHELICPAFGHKNAIKVIKRLYPNGNLKRVIQDVLAKRESQTVLMKARHRAFDFETFETTFSPQAKHDDKPLNNNEIRERLDLNWFYNITKDRRAVGDLRISPKRVSVSRVTKLKIHLPEILQQVGLIDDEGKAERPFRVYIRGSYFWCGEFIDEIEGNIELDVILDGDERLDSSHRVDSKLVKEIFGIRNLNKERAWIRVNTLGTQQLERAACGAVKMRDELRKKLILLPHEGIQLMGDPLEFRPMNSGGVQDVHARNLGSLGEHYRQEIAKEELKPIELDWLRLRTRAIEGYLQAGNEQEAEEEDRQKRSKRSSGPGFFRRWLGRIFGSGIGDPHPLIRKTAGADDGIPLSHTISGDESGTRKLPSTQPVNQTTDMSDESGEVATGNQFMATFYGVILKTGDVLHGYEASYRLVRKLGEGAQGGVWCGEELDDAGHRVHDVALKIPSRHTEWDWNKEAEWRAIVNFNKEINALSKLTWQPNVIRILDWYQEDSDVPFYVMEAISGTDLNDYFENRDFDEKDVLSMFARITKGLAAAHLEGLAHRDLKPENIMIRDADGEPVILDFGSASDVEYTQSMELTAVGAAKGTPVFMSPEMAARLLNEKPSFLVIEKDSAFCANGCTRRFRRDEIIGRIDRAEAEQEDSGETLSVRKASLGERMQFRSARRRTRPIAQSLYENGLIEQEPILDDIRIIETKMITFGAFVHQHVLYAEEPFMLDRSFAKMLIGNPEQEFKQDIYMLGIMIYQRLTANPNKTDSIFAGKLPFDLPTDRSDVWGAVLARLRPNYVPIGKWHRDDPDSFHEIGPALEAIVMKTLSLDPRDRYDARQLEEELHRYVEADPEGQDESKSDAYRRLQQGKRLRRGFFRVTCAVIGAGIVALASEIILTSFPDVLVPRGGNERALEIFTTSVNIGLIAAAAFLGCLIGVATFLGILIVFGREISRSLADRRYITARLDALAASDEKDAGD